MNKSLYDIQTLDAKYPDVTDVLLGDGNNIVTNDGLLAVIDDTLTDLVGLPGFSSDLDKNTKDKYLTNYRRSLRYEIEFPCDGNKVLTEAEFGNILKDKPCKNGKYIYVSSLKNGQFNFANKSDICAGAKEGQSPNITFRVYDFKPVVFDIAFFMTMEMRFTITCGDQTIDITLPAFINKDNMPSVSAIFLATPNHDDKANKVHFYYEFGLKNEFTTELKRTKGFRQVGVPPRRVPTFNWIELPNQPTVAQIWQACTDSNNWEVKSPIDIINFETITYDQDTGKPIINKNSKPDLGDANDFRNGSAIKYSSIQNQFNRLIKECLLMRIAQLENTFKDEVNLYGNEDTKKIFNNNKCVKIKLASYDISVTKLFLYDKFYYGPEQFLEGGEDILVIKSSQDFMHTIQQPQQLPPTGGGMF